MVAEPGVEAVLVVPSLRRGFTANREANSVTIFDLDKLAVIGRVEVGEKPDGLVYEPVSARVLVLNGGSGDVTAIGAETGAVAGRLVLGGTPGGGCADGEGGVFVTVRDADQVARIDCQKLAETWRFPLPGGKEPGFVAYGGAAKQVLVACENRQLFQMNVADGTLASIASIPRKPRGLVWVGSQRLVLLVGEDGDLVTGSLATGKPLALNRKAKADARILSLALDEATGALYSPVALESAIAAPDSVVSAGDSTGRAPDATALRYVSFARYTLR